MEPGGQAIHGLMISRALCRHDAHVIKIRKLEFRAGLDFVRILIMPALFLKKSYEELREKKNPHKTVV